MMRATFERTFDRMEAALKECGNTPEGLTLNRTQLDWRATVNGTPCKFPGCDRRGSSRSLCDKHYVSLRNSGGIHAYPRTREMPRADPYPLSPLALGRFEAKYRVGDLGCWEWQATINHGGYGMFRLAGRLTTAHRVSYQHHVGPIPEGLVIDHLCRNRKCVNPSHLEPVAPAENIRRGVNPTAINARKTHCIHGHEFAGDNVIVDRGGRQCRTCRRRQCECEICGDRMLTTNRARHMRDRHGRQ